MPIISLDYLKDNSMSSIYVEYINLILTDYMFFTKYITKNKLMKNFKFNKTFDTLCCFQDIEFMKKNKTIDLSKFIDYLIKFYNSINNNSKNEIITKEIDTLDSLPGYLTSYSSFIDNIEQYDSNLYSNIEYDTNLNSINNLELEDINNWKLTKKVDRKLTISEIDDFVENRKKDEDNIINNINQNLQNSGKKTELKNFIKNNILDNIEKPEQINNIKKRDYKI
jgi:hypothetical protein